MEETQTDSVYSLEETCRTCLKCVTQSELLPLFNNNEETLTGPNLEFELVLLRIQEDDGFPQNVCQTCMERLSAVRLFRKQCETSHQILGQYFVEHSLLPTKPNDNNIGKMIVSSDKDCEGKIEEENEYYADFEFLTIERTLSIEDEKTISDAHAAEENENEDEDENEAEENEENITIEEVEAENDDRLSDDSRSNGEWLIDSEETDKHSNASCGEEQKMDTHMKCKFCEKIYKRKAHLVRHLAKHRTVDRRKVRKNYAQRTPMQSCNKCGKCFAASKTQSDHESEGKCVPPKNPHCRFCKQKLENMAELEVHLASMHPKGRPHICPICKKSFQSVSNRNTHLQSHNKENSYKCELCKQGFKSKVYLNKHKKSVHTTGDHQCPHCSMKFENTVKFEYHLKSHDPNKKYKCKFCEKSFLQHHHLSNHERTHTGLRPYLCNICGKDFKQDCNFKLHLRIHSGVRPYVCNVCGKDFIQRGTYVMHMRKHTGVRPYQCETCGKDFIQKSSLTVHLRTHTGERPYKCDSCDKAFVQTQQLKCHKHSVHGGPPVNAASETSPKDINEEHERDLIAPSPNVRHFPYMCPICNKGFKLPSSLSSHIKVHNEDRKHVCHHCGNTFKRAEHLKIHINGVHLKQKPYQCELCNKSFAQSGDRNIHMRRHTGEKPHNCTFCNKSFRLLKAMRAHARIHTGERPYNCEICKLDFMTYTALATHTMKHKDSQVTSG